MKHDAIVGQGYVTMFADVLLVEEHPTPNIL